jgi:DNA-binding protein Alba
MTDDLLKSAKIVIVGVKPTMNYVVACLTLFNAGDREVRLRARGRHISKAVDTVEMLRRVFMKDVAVDEVAIGTEDLINEGGTESSVSTIDIWLTKPNFS